MIVEGSTPNNFTGRQCTSFMYFVCLLLNTSKSNFQNCYVLDLKLNYDIKGIGLISIEYK